MNTMTRPTVDMNTVGHQTHTLQASDVMMDQDVMSKLMRMAEIMASSTVTVPKHLHKQVGDCFAVCVQAMQWSMNPFSVAQKTHVVNGTLGYEAQLVNAVIITRAPITGRLKFDFYGDWTKVNGKEDKSPERGVIVSATFKGEDEPRVLDLGMHQVGGVRNSPMWLADPRQQLAYLAVKRWSRLYCPDVILGVYTPDEIEPEAPAPERDVTEQVVEPKKHSGSSALKDRLNTRSKKQDSNVVEGQAVEFDVVGTIDQINRATTLDQLSAIASHVPANIGEPAKTDIKNAYRKRKTELASAAAPAPEPEVLPMPEPEPVATSPMIPRESVNAIIAEMKNAQTDDDLTRIWETRVSAFVDSIDDVDFEELDLVYAARGAELNA